ncbi:MAG: type VI secretion system protein TssA [Alphaproteobacteria bacterium]|nr:type VI secretion system protein TssA [Alphaproteobacteria bacterium]
MAQTNVSSSLLNPIPGDMPCGKYLRYTEFYDQIREARREEDDKLPQGVWKVDVKRADWEKVSQLCQMVLIHQTKDLQIAAWLTEAWLHLEGLAGLAKGLNLITQLTQKFWENIHPQLDKENAESRIIPYEWMNSKLSVAIQTIMISLPNEKSRHTYRFLDYTDANRLNPNKKIQPLSSPDVDTKPSSATISLSIKETPTYFYQNLEENCSLSLEASDQLEKVLTSHLQSDAPTFFRIREQIKDVQRLACQILKVRGESKINTQEEVTVQQKEQPPSETSSENSNKSTLAPLAIKSRAQAYTILAEVAAYLERVEPHSPTPYLIHRAIAWGGMSLAEVISDTLNNGQDMSLLLDILNVKKEKTKTP